jgi:hypothetical protein
VLKQSTWSRDKDVHSGKTVTLIFEILPTNDDASGEAVVSAYRPQDVKYLDRLW